jgi:hypothetical protein
LNPTDFQGYCYNGDRSLTATSDDKESAAMYCKR